MERQTSNPAPSGRNGGAIPAEMRRQMIAVAAYFRAEQRGFRSGDELADWLEAEAEIERRLPRMSDDIESSAKRAFQQRLETQIEEWDARIDALKTRALKAKAGIRADYEKQLDALSGKRQAADEKLRELRRRTEDAWVDLKEGMEKAWGEMREAIDRAASRLK